jgi:hypothetical protein
MTDIDEDEYYDRQMEMMRLADDKLDTLAVFMGDLAVAQKRLLDTMRATRLDVAGVRAEEKQRYEETRAEEARRHEETRAEEARRHEEIMAEFEAIRAEEAKRHEEAMAELAEIRKTTERQAEATAKTVDRLAGIVEMLVRREAG